MNGREHAVLRACLLAYPKEQRSRDCDLLLDLAADLSGDHGTWREAAGLVRGGLSARLARLRSRRVTAAVALGVFLVAATVAATSMNAEVSAEVDVHQTAAR